MTRPRYSIMPADAFDDQRLGDLHIRVLGILGTHTDNNGWCEVNQKKIAERCGRARETVNRAIRDLCAFGYLRKTDRVTSSNGRTISRYQVVMDREERPPHHVTSASHGPVTQPEHSASDEAGAQLNDPFFNDLSPQPPLAGGPDFSVLWEEWPASCRGNRANAEGAFKRLDVASRYSAIRAVALTLKVLGLRKSRVPALVRYLRDKLFLEFDGAPDVDRDGDFVLRPDRPEFAAWLGVVRREHGESGVQRAIRSGFMARKTRWPEAPRVGATRPGDGRRPQSPEIIGAN